MSSKLCFLPNFVELPKLPLHLPRMFSYFYSMWTVSPTSQWMKIVQIFKILDCVISNWSAKRLDFTLTIDHATLTNRLSNWYGISGQVQILFSSSLKNRYKSLKKTFCQIKLHSHMSSTGLCSVISAFYPMHYTTQRYHLQFWHKPPSLCRRHLNLLYPFLTLRNLLRSCKIV